MSLIQLFCLPPNICFVLFRAGEPGVFGSLEPELLEKKRGAGAAWKKKSGASAGASKN